jgi:hypothetical protein
LKKVPLNEVTAQAFRQWEPPNKPALTFNMLITILQKKEQNHTIVLNYKLD